MVSGRSVTCWATGTDLVTVHAPIDPLRSYEDFAKSVRDFGWLSGVVPGAMDVDVLIERKGQFLVIEGKPWRNGVLLPYGQHKALYALSKLDNFRVYLVGEDKDDVYVALYNGAPAPAYLRQSSSSLWPAERFVPTNKDGLAKLVKVWWDEVDAD